MDNHAYEPDSDLPSPMSSNSYPININRRIFLTKDFFPLSHDSSDAKKENSFFKKLKTYLHHQQRLSSITLTSILFTLCPILKWGSRYRLKNDLIYDLITGITIVALHIPQGLAYGKLAGVEPIYGLYVSLFPVIIYAVFGGSHQISIGTYAVISIACRDVISLVQADYPDIPPIEILTALCLLVGMIQCIVGIFRLGILTTLVSDPIISAFCVGATLHVLTSQVFALFEIDSSEGADKLKNIPFDILRNWIRFFKRLEQINWATVLLSCLTTAVIYGCKRCLEPYLKKRFKLKNLAIPIDIIVIITLTLISHQTDLNGRYQISTIPKITAGFTGLPVVPRLDLFSSLITSAIMGAFICYTSTWSLMKLYAKQHHYPVYPNQELLALGLANVGSSFFLCYPSAGSLSRSAVQNQVGGRTQLASLISSCLVVFFILYLSPFLSALPKCTLSCIIVVALMPTLFKFRELLDYWNISKLDGLLWIATFFLVTFMGVDYGLLYSIMAGLGLLVFRFAMPSYNTKFQIPDSECYIGNTSASKSMSGIMIFEFHAPLLFINVERFKQGFKQLVMEKLQQQQMPSKMDNNRKANIRIDLDANNNERMRPIHTVILDMSRISFMDAKAVETLREIEENLYKFFDCSVKLFLATPSPPVMETLMACKYFEHFNAQYCFFTVHDAVIAASGDYDLRV